MRRKNGFTALIITIIIFLLLLASCTAQQPAANNTANQDSGTAQGSDREPIKLTFAHYQAIGSCFDIAINEWTKQVTEASDGLITFQIFGGGSLGAAADHYDMVRSGTCDIAYSFGGIHSGIFKTYETFALPMLGFTSAVQASEAHWDYYENYGFAKEEMKNVHLLSVHSCTPYVVCTVDLKIESADDLKGHGIRVAGGPINRFFTALGAITMTVPITDIYENLEKKITEGCVIGIDGLPGYKLTDLITNVLTTGVQVGTYYTWMNIDTWNGLPDWAKDIFDEYGGMNGAIFFGEMTEEYDAKTYADLRSEGKIELNELSAEEFANWEATAMDITKTWIEELNAAGHDGQAIYDTVIQLRDKYAK
ncbi:MAG: TRAP transporter substrate-binding protein DctP [Gracilibacteraceae bacterium]|jgi:TRAP-type C4-dicarboxylate transport system substrate-binding protein|nr:TRAP transporter substrate-binding protein DctP [Gracilibacteraceae bacterium]